MKRGLKVVLLVLFMVGGVQLFIPKFGTKVSSQGFPEAQSGYDNKTNGWTDQSLFDDDRKTFEDRDTIEDGLGPVYNAQSCAECHQNTVTGGGSQILVVRAGHKDQRGDFVEAPGGSLINDRAIDASLQEFVPPEEKIRAQRISLSVLGDGYVEAIDDQTLLNIARNQVQQTGGAVSGQAILVPILEAPGTTRVGRFGWKSQHASLLSFSADAYLNEVGITSRLMPEENTSLGKSVTAFDTVADVEDFKNDIDVFTRFMRATKAPGRDFNLAISPDGIQGSQLFGQVGCAVCHVPTIITAKPGTALNGGTFTVTEALGSKAIHPYGDFLLHNVGTGDGIVQNGGQDTANKMRTAPLWGLRTRNRYMHDGQSLSLDEAIKRHGGEATTSVNKYMQLNDRQRSQLHKFMKSL